jgi:hypothetical protein
MRRRLEIGAVLAPHNRAERGEFARHLERSLSRRRKESA